MLTEKQIVSGVPLTGRVSHALSHGLDNHVANGLFFSFYNPSFDQWTKPAKYIVSA